MLQVALQTGTQAGHWASLRGLCGHDEMTITDISTQSASRLLNRLLVQTPGSAINPGTAQDLTVSDHDRILAMIYRHHFGDRIEGSTQCTKCTEAFDLDFSAADLAVKQKSISDGVSGPDENGFYTLADGLRFRLPTPLDQIRITGVEAVTAQQALLDACIVDRRVDFDFTKLEKAMSEVGPLLTTNLSASCPHCDSEQQISFDIQSHLLTVMIKEKQWLPHEVHRLALAYGWKLSEILDLSREDRRTYVRLVLADRDVKKRIN